MIAALVHGYHRGATWLAGRVPEGLALLLARVALACVFWRSGRSKIEDGSWATISDSTYELFETEYAGVPLPPDFAAVLATGAEHLFPILLVLGLFTRMSSFALLVMTAVIQIFVYPEA
jgi:putative oxidoreductase